MSSFLPPFLPEETHNFSSILKYSRWKNFHFYESGIFSQQTGLPGNFYLVLNSPHSPGLLLLSASVLFFFFYYYFDHRLLGTGVVPPGAAIGLLWDEGQRCPGQPESSSGLGKMNAELHLCQRFLLPVSAALLLSHILAPFIFDCPFLFDC